MKRIALTLVLCASTLCAAAQTLLIHQGQVSVAVPAADAGTMTYTNGTTLTVAGTDYAISDIDSITVSSETVEAATVAVSYSDQTASVVVSADVAPQLTITASAANVSIVAASTLATEVNYVLTGTSTDGSFYMDGDYKSTLTLNGLTLTNASGAPITIDNGKRINVVVTDGTTNTLTDCASGTQKACFFINGHAEFSGAGTLNLTGNTKHAYASDEYTLFKKSFGTLNVLAAANDGLHIQQYLQVKGGTINVSGTTGDCIDVSVTSDTTDELNGQVLIAGGTLTLDVATDDVKGMKCDSLMTISGGTINATVSGDGSKGLSVGTDLLVNETSGNSTAITMSVTGTTYMADTDSESKCRGIKVKGAFTFDGGTISISATGKKSKAISVDGDYTYKSGSINCSVDAANT